VSFRVRLAVTCAALTVLAAAFALGLLLPEGGREARAEEPLLLPLSSPAQIAEMEIYSTGRSLSLRRKDGGWEAREGGQAWPASAERAEALAGLLAGLRQGKPVSRDPARRAELGLESGGLLVLRRGEGGPELRLRVGARAPSGQEDYLGLEGQEEVYLVRGNLSVLLAQDRAYWLDLYVFPDEVRGETIARITVRGQVLAGAGEPPIRGGYTLTRAGEGWTLDGEPADAQAAQAMVEALARLEGQDLLAAGAAPAAATTADGPSGGLEGTVTTLDGRTYPFRARWDGNSLLLRAGGSPWVYPVNPRLLARAVRPAEELRGR
jgi:hypothetical protein